MLKAAPRHVKRRPERTGRARGGDLVLLLKGDGVDVQAVAEEASLVGQGRREMPPRSIRAVVGETRPSDHAVRQGPDHHEASVAGLECATAHAAVSFEMVFEAFLVEGGGEEVQPTADAPVRRETLHIIRREILEVVMVDVVTLGDDRPNAYRR